MSSFPLPQILQLQALSTEGQKVALLKAQIFTISFSNMCMDIWHS